MKIAFIVQRYGAEILGQVGISLPADCRAARAPARRRVLTTCAADYITWKNSTQGTDRIRGVTVRRFPNAHTRDLDAFNRYSGGSSRAPTRSDEMEWLRRQGLVPGAARIPRTQPPAMRRPDLLHLPLRTDRTRRADRPEKSILVPDRARQAGHPPRDLQRVVQRASRHRLQHRSRAAVPDHPLLDSRDRGGNRRVRRRPAASASLPARPVDRGATGGARRGQSCRGRGDGRRRGLADLPASPGAPRLGVPPASPAAGPFLLYGRRIDPGKGCEG